MDARPSSYVRWCLQISGILKPKGCRMPLLFSVYSVYSLLAIASSFIGGLVFVVVNGTALEKLQSVGISITILNGLLKQSNDLLNKKGLSALLDDFDTQWDLHYGEPDNRPLMDPVRQRIQKLFKFLVYLCIMVMAMNSLVPVILYFLLGADRFSFQIVVPMQDTWNFVPVHLIQFALTLHPFFINTTHNFLYFTLSKQLGAYISVIRRKLREGMITKDTIRAHQEIIRLNKNLNDLFGHLLYFETKTVAIECSCAAFIVYKVNIGKGNFDNIVNNMIFFTFCYLIPYIICYCGSIITSENDALVKECYWGPWYEQDLQSRKHLKFLMLGASKPLTLHYKYLAVFNMELFLGILNGTYTFLNALVWLEKAGEKSN